VTERIRPLVIDGRPVHQIAMPWHWGFNPPYTGDSTNDLGVLSGEPNVAIQESKAFSCDVRAGRRTRATTAPLAGVHLDHAVNTNEDDVMAEAPKETPP
jgi:formate dehydrogenase major subunit